MTIKSNPMLEFRGRVKDQFDPMLVAFWRGYEAAGWYLRGEGKHNCQAETNSDNGPANWHCTLPEGHKGPHCATGFYVWDEPEHDDELWEAWLDG